MGYVSIGVVAITVLIVAYSTLVGALRGRNRALLRLILVLACGVAAFLLRETVMNMLMEIEVQGKTVGSLVGGYFEDLPESTAEVISLLMNTIIVFVVYLVSFEALKGVSWMIIYPICKAFVKRGEFRRSGGGAFFGLVQGLLIVMLVIAPVSGLVSTVDRITSMEIGEGKSVLSSIDEDGQMTQTFEDIGLSGYSSGTVGKVYDTIGGWYFDMVTTVTKEDGNKTSLTKLTNATEAAVEVAKVFVDGEQDLETISSDTATKEEKISALKSFGNRVKTAGEKADALGADEKDIINAFADFVMDAVGGTSESEEVTKIIGDGANITAAGDAIISIAEYYETETVTDEQIAKIVKGFADNPFIIDIFGDSEIHSVSEADKPRFKAEIEKTSLSTERKNKLLTMFGIEA